MQQDSPRHRVVIIGSGFGGLFAAKALRRADVNVTVIGKTAHHLFQPLLYQVATGILSVGEIAPATREILRRQANARVLLGTVTDIDVEARTVTSQAPADTVVVTPYDTLVLAAGAGQSYFGNDRFAEFAPGMKSIDDALELRGRIFGAFELAELEEDQEAIDRWQTFVVVGAGPTGVEMAGQISELAHRTLRADFRRIDPTRSRVILLDAADRVLPTFHERLSENARRRLERMGVEVQLGTKVVDVDAPGVEVVTPDGEHRRIEAATKIWAAGVAANPLGPLLAQKTGAETDRAGRVKVAPDCTVPGHPEIFVVGDLMALDKLPGVAQVAMQSGKHAAKEIKRRLAGEATPKPFHYFDKGNMATISRFSAIADIPRVKVRLTGFLAWLAWLFIHIIYLIGFKNRVTTLLHWFVSFIGRGRSERTSTEQQVFGRRAMERVGGQLSSSVRPGGAAGAGAAAGPPKDLASPAPDPGRAPAVTVPTGAALRDQ